MFLQKKLSFQFQNLTGMFQPKILNNLQADLLSEDLGLKHINFTKTLITSRLRIFEKAQQGPFASIAISLPHFKIKIFNLKNTILNLSVKN